MTGQDSSLTQRRFLVLAATMCLLAFVLREQFLLITQVDRPIRGDIVQYVTYADNLVHSATFSSVWPGSGAPTPDSFRGPGYPLFLGAVMLLKPQPDGWYNLALQAQALLGTATVLLGMALGRYWLSRAATLGAGLLIAIWPHHVAATGALLSEVLFGFVLMLAAWATVKATSESRIRWGVTAGLAFGYAYLINPLTVFFPPLLALLLWREKRQVALCLLLIPALTVALWAGRNSSLPDQLGPGRASMNFVQGSWPSFHQAWKYSDTGPVAGGIIRAMGKEQSLLDSSPARGLQAIMGRMTKEPMYYLRWYVLDKPYLLWDWNIRVGFGDVYFLEVKRSPWETNPALARLKRFLHRANLGIFLLSAAASFTMLWRYWRTPLSKFAPLLVALCCIYVTLVHTVFQAEPRYAIPYRPFQMLLLVTALSTIASWLYSRRQKLLGQTPGMDQETPRTARGHIPDAVDDRT